MNVKELKEIIKSLPDETLIGVEVGLMQVKPVSYCGLVNGKIGKFLVISADMLAPITDWYWRR